VSQVQQIETTIGDDQFLPPLPERRAPSRQDIPIDEFGAKIHGEILAEAISSWQRF
jgi:hypothetical protein